MVTRILLIDNNCLDRLRSPAARSRLKANLRATGRTFWPTGLNVLEALKSRDRETRVRLLGILAELSDGRHAFTLPGEALRRIAVAAAEGAEKVDWSEPSITRLFRDPESVADEEAAAAREHLLSQDLQFNEVHERAHAELKPLHKAEGGHRRWTSAAQYVEEFWSGPEQLAPYIDKLWASWGRPGPAPVAKLLAHESWRLYFAAWGASVYARQIQHPQRGVVQISDLTQLPYLGAARSRILASDDKPFRNLANAILRCRYHQAEVVPLDAVIH